MLVPAGYMAKRVIARPGWLDAERVESIYSVSGCVSETFTDYIPFWKHNGYWMFDSPEPVMEIAREAKVDLAGTTLFFYEVHELEFDAGEWKAFQLEASFETHVRVPEVKVLEGYDVVTFYVRTSPECSPLSCNGLASEIETNSRCLLDSFEGAVKLLEDGAFENSEPGPYRVFAVYTVPWPSTAMTSR